MSGPMPPAQNGRGIFGIPHGADYRPELDPFRGMMGGGQAGQTPAGQPPRGQVPLPRPKPVSMGGPPGTGTRPVVTKGQDRMPQSAPTPAPKPPGAPPTPPVKPPAGPVPAPPGKPPTPTPTPTPPPAPAAPAGPPVAGRFPTTPPGTPPPGTVTPQQLLDAAKKMYPQNFPPPGPQSAMPDPRADVIAQLMQGQGQEMYPESSEA